MRFLLSLIKAGDAGSESDMTVSMMNNLVEHLFWTAPYNRHLARYLPNKQMVEVGFIGTVFFDLRF
jgi:hypothetical protein